MSSTRSARRRNPLGPNVRRARPRKSTRRAGAGERWPGVLIFGIGACAVCGDVGRGLWSWVAGQGFVWTPISRLLAECIGGAVAVLAFGARHRVTHFGPVRQGPVLARAFLVLCGIVTGVAVGVGWRRRAPRRGSAWSAVGRRRVGRSSSDPAAWADRRALRTLRVRGRRGPRGRIQVDQGSGRLVLGRIGRALLATEARHSVLVLGPTQSGKTSGLVIPALLEWEGPVVATSVKRDLLDATYARRQQLGDVLVFDPTACSGVPSVSWDPLGAATSWDGARRVAANLCGVARREAGGLDDGAFWYATAEKLLAPLLFAAACSGRGFADVCAWVDLREQEEPLAALVETGVPAAWQAAVASFDRDERALSSVYATVEHVLAGFCDPGVLTRSDTALRPAELFTHPASTLFLVAPSRAQERLAPVFVALLGEVLEPAFLRGGGVVGHPPVLVVLDEAANIAPVRDLDVLASTAAGYGIQLLTVFQDLAKVKARYGARSATVVNNHRARILCSGVADPKTLGEISTLVGEGEVLSSTTSEGRDSSTTTWANERRALAPPDALRRIAPGEAVLLYGHLPPARMVLRPWFADRALRQLAGAPRDRRRQHSRTSCATDGPPSASDHPARPRFGEIKVNGT